MFRRLQKFAWKKSGDDSVVSDRPLHPYSSSNVVGTQHQSHENGGVESRRRSTPIRDNGSANSAKTSDEQEKPTTQNQLPPTKAILETSPKATEQAGLPNEPGPELLAKLEESQKGEFTNPLANSQATSGSRGNGTTGVPKEESQDVRAIASAQPSNPTLAANKQIKPEIPTTPKPVFPSAVPAATPVPFPSGETQTQTPPPQGAEPKLHIAINDKPTDENPHSPVYHTAVSDKALPEFPNNGPHSILNEDKNKESMSSETQQPVPLNEDHEEDHIPAQPPRSLNVDRTYATQMTASKAARDHDLSITQEDPDIQSHGEASDEDEDEVAVTSQPAGNKVESSAGPSPKSARHPVVHPPSVMPPGGPVTSVVVDMIDTPWATGLPLSPTPEEGVASSEVKPKVRSESQDDDEPSIRVEQEDEQQGSQRKMKSAFSWSRKEEKHKGKKRMNMSRPLSLFKNAKVKEVKDEDISDKDIIIGVMGPTGSGKSSFISKATGFEGLVGHDLKSCTSRITTIKLSVPELVDADIVFVDTPGFDDTNIPDTEILEMISNWLNKTYSRSIHLDGLLYFHRISDNRMAGTPLKNLRLFDKICGDYGNVILTTTMWGDVEQDEGDQREKELMEIYWKSMIKRGSQVRRFLHSQPSAFDVLEPIIENANQKHALKLQEEMTNLQMELRDTEAGKTLFLQLQHLVAKHQSMLERIRRELREPNMTADDLKMLMADYQKVSEDLKKATEEMQTIATKSNVTIGDRLKRAALVPKNFFGFINTLRNFMLARRQKKT